MVIQLDILQTLAIAVLVLFIGRFVKRFVKILDKLCIPDPVIGGILFSLFSLFGYSTGLFTFELDTTLQAIFMTVFFTAVGFTCDVKVLLRYGKRGLAFTVVLFVLIISQNLIGIGIASAFDINPLIGLCTGSVSMTGGHGTSGAFGPLFEGFGCEGALTIALAAATFGLVSGGLIGGPVSSFLVRRHHLADCTTGHGKEKLQVNADQEPEIQLTGKNMISASNQVIIAMGVGTIIFLLLKRCGITFPSYMGGMLMGVIMRNISSYTGKFSIPLAEIDCLGNISLSLFVSMALMSLKLWQLAALALPMIVILLTQVVFIAIFMIVVGFRILGGDYDAAVMVSGFCGFGLGAMPNGVANMQSFTKKYGPSPTAFFVVPGAGSVIIDVVNALLITAFMNFLV